MELDVLKIHDDPPKQTLKMDTKKSKKPQMEKLRRARINDSLNELKSLVLEAMKKDVSRYSKMEKADILEMTVKYLRSSQEKQTKLSDPSSLVKYRAGFNECAAEVARFLMTTENVSDQLRTHLLSHLASHCYTQTQAIMSWTNPRANGVVGYPAQVLRSPSKMTAFTAFSLPGTGGVTFPANLPSPPSSPLHQQDSGVRLTGPSPVLFSNGIPAVIVPNDALQLLPLTWQNSLSPYDSTVWRPW